MKIIYADMSLELAIEYLRSAHQLDNIITIDDRHGYTAMFNLIGSIDYMSNDSIFLTNNPAAVSRIKCEMSLEYDGFRKFLNACQVVSINKSGFSLVSISKKADKELCLTHNIERVLLDDLLN